MHSARCPTYLGCLHFPRTLHLRVSVSLPIGSRNETNDNPLIRQGYGLLRNSQLQIRAGLADPWGLFQFVVDAPKCSSPPLLMDPRVDPTWAGIAHANLMPFSEPWGAEGVLSKRPIQAEVAKL